MKTKTLIAGFFIVFALILNTGFVSGQEIQQGTFIEESGETEDSTKMADVLDYDFDVEGESSSNTGLIVGIAAIVLIGGAVIIFLRKKKK